jgi:hypothetical protein
MFQRVASIRSSLRVVALCALILSLAAPALLPVRLFAEDIDSDSGRDAARRSQVYDPGVGRTGDDDQPTIGGRRHGREFAVSSDVSPVTPAPRPEQPAPLAQPRGWLVQMFVQWFLMRLGVMLR